MRKIYNFSAGPACLPESALKASKSAVKDYKNSGISILEMSHRSAPVVELFEDTTKNLINLLDIPENYFPTDDISLEPINRWRPYAFLLFTNFINEVYQDVPFSFTKVNN